MLHAVFLKTMQRAQEIFYLDESNLVGDVQSINISGELDVGLLVTIRAIHHVK